MGVKDLWGILNPTCERKPIWELQGKTIAVDLSAWICDSTTVAEHSSQRNMYLRNLFFRTSSLLLLGVQPIFVLEGKAPLLKHDTIERRQVAQAKSAGRKIKASNGSDGSRRRLKGLQTQCAALLDSLGLKCIQGDGEAEAFCACLNQFGIVDGVVTQDSDVFLYGAVTVFRHFNTSSAGGGSVDTYQMAKITSQLGLGRNHLIALSLLCGCDYSTGVPGVGKELALRFFQSIPDEQVLHRIRQWRQNIQLDSIDVKKDKSLTPEFKAELQIRAKALHDPNFPCEELIAEFMQTNQQSFLKAKFKWCKPNISQFLKIADVKLAWDSTYSLQKILPLLSRWHLIHHDLSLEPELILSAKTTKGVKGYVVKWKDFEVTTEEPQNLVEERFPNLVEAFMETRKKGKKTSKKNKENEGNAPSKANSKRTKTKGSQSSDTGKGDVLQELNTEHCNEKYEQHDGNTDGIQMKNNKSKRKNREQAVNSELKKNYKKNTKDGTLGEKQEKSCRSLNKQSGESADIREYFKSKLNEKLDQTNSQKLLEESLNVLNSSLNSLSISKTGLSEEGKIATNEWDFIEDLEMSSIVIEDTLGVRRDDIDRRERHNADLDYFKNKSSSDCLSNQSLENISRQREEKLESLDDGDIFNCSFNTACQMINTEPIKTEQIKSVANVKRKSVEIQIKEQSVLTFTDDNTWSNINMSTNSFKTEKSFEKTKSCKTSEDTPHNKEPSRNANSEELSYFDFHMSVNINNSIQTDTLELKTSEILDTSENHPCKDLECTPQKFYESFQSQLKSSNTSGRNIDLEESMSFTEEQQLYTDIPQNCVSKSSSCESQINSITGQQRSNFWNASSPLVRYNPTQVSTSGLEVQSEAMDLNSPMHARLRPSLSFSIGDFECNETGDLSDIVENIVSQK